LRLSLFFAVCFNFLIIMHFLPYANANYIINILVMMSILIAMGFLLVADMAFVLIKKIKDANLGHKGSRSFENAVMIILSVFFLFISSLVFFENYQVLDRSEPEQVYLFWDDAIRTMEQGAYLYANSPSSNVGMFVADFEQKAARDHIHRLQSRRLQCRPYQGNALPGKTGICGG
jgi:magnesium-transporting ATPase (P-type)